MPRSKKSRCTKPKRSTGNPNRSRRKAPCKSPNKRVKRKNPCKSSNKRVKRKSPCKSSKKDAVKFYCVKTRCPVTVPSEDIRVAKTKNGRYMLKGWCSKHECYLCKFIKDCDAKKMMEKYGKC